MHPEIKLVELPPQYLQPDGRMRQFYDQFDLNGERCYFLLPSGIGDVAWCVSKLWKVAEERECVFVTPEAGNFNRVDPYLDLMGLKHERRHIDIRRLLEFPGEFDKGEYDNGGVFFIHANRHIEEGKPLHESCPKYWKYKIASNNYTITVPASKDTWHPWLPFKNPAPFIERQRHRNGHYLVVHMASESYCEGNWFPRLWARLIREIEQKRQLPVMLMGAKWDEPMVEKVSEIYEPAMPPCIGQTFETALTRIVNSIGMIGVDSGLSIMATYLGLPALRAYPRWLHLMPGTWEDCATLHPHNKAIFMDELMDEAMPWVNNLEVS